MMYGSFRALLRRKTALFLALSLVTAACDRAVDSTEPAVKPVKVARVQVSASAVTIEESDAQTLVALPYDSAGRALFDRTVRWSSRDSSIAVVDAGGRVTGRRAGSAVIVASVDEQSAEVVVTVVRVAVASIAVTPAPIVLDVAKTRQLTAIIRDRAGNFLSDRVVQWTTDSPNVASVSSSGLVTAVGPGYATIIARSEGKTFGVAVTVSPDGEYDPAWIHR